MDPGDFSYSSKDWQSPSKEGSVWNQVISLTLVKIGSRHSKREVYGTR